MRIGLADVDVHVVKFLGVTGASAEISASRLFYMRVEFLSSGERSSGGRWALGGSAAGWRILSGFAGC